MEQVENNPYSPLPVDPQQAETSHALSVEDRLHRLENVFNSAAVGLCFLDIGFRYVTVNECFAAMYEQTCAHFLGRTVRQALPAVADQIMAHLEHSLAVGGPVSVELTLTRALPNGGEPRRLVYLRSAQPMRNHAGTVVGFSVALIDITERKAAEAAVRESEENYRYTVELNPHIPWSIESGGTLVRLNSRFTALTGLPHREVSLDAWRDIIHGDERQKTVTAWLCAVAAGTPFDATYRTLCNGGDYRWMRSRAFPRHNAEGEVIRWYGTLEDIHERTLIDEALRNKTARLEEVSAELALLVREDHLTGLANRRHFDDALQREMTRARRSHQPLALIMFDVDHFKRFNDTYGHPTGDLCLRDVGQALKRSLRRQGDVAARYGGEEFVLLLPDTPEEGALKVAQFATDAVRTLHIPHTASETGFLTISAGVAAFEPEGDLAHRNAAGNLIQMADIALYAAKSAGRNLAIGAAALNERALKKASA